MSSATTATTATTAPKATLVSLHAKNYRLFPANKEGSCVKFSGSSTLVGPSGFGKTTVFATINDLLFYCVKGVGYEPPSHCTLTDKSVSVVILRVDCGETYYVLGMWRNSKDEWNKFARTGKIDPASKIILESWAEQPKQMSEHSLADVEEIANRIAKWIAFLPQDYGFRKKSDREAEWLFTYDKFCKQNEHLNEETRDALAKITTVQVAYPYRLFSKPNVKEVKKDDNLELKLKLKVEKDVFYFQKNDKFPLSRLSGGQLDVIMTMHCATSGRPIVLLDEPGQNVGAAERGMLRQVLDSVQSKPQILMVTHHTEMMDFESFPKSAIRVAIDHTSSVRFRRNIPYSKAVYQSYEAEIAPKDKELLFQGHILPSIFARFVLLVEGHTDVPVLEKFLSSCRDAYDIKLGLRIIACGGSDNLKLVDKMLTALEVDHMVLCDTDVVFESTAERRKWLPKTSDGLLFDLINRWSRHWVNLLYGTELKGSYGRDILLKNFWRSFTVVPRELLQRQQAIEELVGYLEDNAQKAKTELKNVLDNLKELQEKKEEEQVMDSLEGGLEDNARKAKSRLMFVLDDMKKKEEEEQVIQDLKAFLEDIAEKATDKLENVLDGMKKGKEKNNKEQVMPEWEAFLDGILKKVTDKVSGVLAQKATLVRRQVMAFPLFNNVNTAKTKLKKVLNDLKQLIEMKKETQVILQSLKDKAHEAKTKLMNILDDANSMEETQVILQSLKDIAHEAKTKLMNVLDDLKKKKEEQVMEDLTDCLKVNAHEAKTKLVDVLKDLKKLIEKKKIIDPGIEKLEGNLEKLECEVGNLNAITKKELAIEELEGALNDVKGKLKNVLNNLNEMKEKKKQAIEESKGYSNVNAEEYSNETKDNLEGVLANLDGIIEQKEEELATEKSEGAMNVNVIEVKGKLENVSIYLNKMIKKKEELEQAMVESGDYSNETKNDVNDVKGKLENVLNNLNEMIEQNEDLEKAMVELEGYLNGNAEVAKDELNYKSEDLKKIIEKKKKEIAMEELEEYLEANAERAKKALSFSSGQTEVVIRMEIMSELEKLELDNEKMPDSMSVKKSELVSQLQDKVKMKITNKLNESGLQNKLKSKMISKLKVLALSEEKKLKLVSEFDKLEFLFELKTVFKLKELALSKEKKLKLVSEFNKLEFLLKLKSKVILGLSEENKLELGSEFNKLEFLLKLQSALKLKVLEYPMEKKLELGSALNIQEEVKLKIQEEVKLEIQEEVKLEIQEEVKLERMSELYNKVQFAVISELKRLESPEETVKTWFKDFLEKVNALPGEDSESFDVENASLQDLADESSRVFFTKLKALLKINDLRVLISRNTLPYPNSNTSTNDAPLSEEKLKEQLRRHFDDIKKLAVFEKWTCETTLICCTLLSRLHNISSALLKKKNHPESKKFKDLAAFLNGSVQSQQTNYFLPCWNERFGIKDKDQLSWLASKITGEAQDQAKIQGEQSARYSEQFQTGFFEHGVDRSKYNEDYEKILDEFFYQAFVGSANPEPKQAESKTENSKDKPKKGKLSGSESKSKDSNDRPKDKQAEPLKSEPSVLIWPPSIADIEGLLYDKTVNSDEFSEEVQHWREHDDRKKLCYKLADLKAKSHRDKKLLDKEHKTIEFCKRAFEFAGIITKKKKKKKEKTDE